MAFYVLLLTWSDGSTPTALASLLQPSQPTDHLRHTVFRHFPNISRTCISFLLVFSLSSILLSFLLLSSILLSSPLLSSALLFSLTLPIFAFISPYCRKFDFETCFDKHLKKFCLLMKETFSWKVITAACPLSFLQQAWKQISFIRKENVFPDLTFLHVGALGKNHLLGIAFFYFLSKVLSWSRRYSEVISFAKTVLFSTSSASCQEAVGCCCFNAHNSDQMCM